MVSQYETGPQSKQDQIPADFILKSCRPGKSSLKEKNTEREKEKKERNKEKEKEIKNVNERKRFLFYKKRYVHLKKPDLILKSLHGVFFGFL